MSTSMGIPVTRTIQWGLSGEGPVLNDRLTQSSYGAKKSEGWYTGYTTTPQRTSGSPVNITPVCNAKGCRPDQEDACKHRLDSPA